MDTLSYKTKFTRTEDIKRTWYIVDATNQTVGRLGTRVAHILMGKHKPSFTRHQNDGDSVIIINADKVRFTGKKWAQKTYQRYSGYPGGLSSRTANEQHAKNPNIILEKAIKGMLPKNRLGRAMFRNVFVYSGSEHPHEAQQPKELKY